MNDDNLQLGVSIFVPSSSERLLVSKLDELKAVLGTDIFIISHTEAVEIRYGDKPINVTETFVDSAPWQR